jgi:hypothetical protein
MRIQNIFDSLRQTLNSKQRLIEKDYISTFNENCKCINDYKLSLQQIENKLASHQIEVKGLVTMPPIHRLESWSLNDDKFLDLQKIKSPIFKPPSLNFKDSSLLTELDRLTTEINHPEYPNKGPSRGNSKNRASYPVRRSEIDFSKTTRSSSNQKARRGGPGKFSRPELCSNNTFGRNGWNPTTKLNGKGAPGGSDSQERKK